MRAAACITSASVSSATGASHSHRNACRLTVETDVAAGAALSEQLTVNDAASSRRRTQPGGGELLIVYGVAAAILARLSVVLGKDTNWDLQNYHAYAPWALLHGGYSRDVLAGNWQAYLNPSIYLVRHALVAALRPRAAGAALAAVQALNVLILYAITSRVFSQEDRGIRVVLSCLGAALGAVSAMFISEVGTSFSDILVSVPTLAAVLVLLPPDGDDDARLRPRRLAFAGAIMGFALGLKLSNLALAAAFASAVLVGWASWRERLRAGLAAGVGGGLGVLASALPWALRMQREFGHPLFPLFGVGQSAVQGARDLRYQPTGVLHALSYPWKWATGVGVSSELPFTDIRPLLLVVLAVTVCVRLLTASRAAVGETRVAERRLATFLGAGTGLWLATSGLHRHAMPLDLLVGPAIVVCCRRLVGGRLAIVASAAVACAALATVQPPDWGRQGWSRTWFDVVLPPVLERPATYVLLSRTGAPLGYIAPFFPVGSVFVQYNFAAFVPPGSVLERRARTILADTHPDRTFVIVDAPPDDEAARIARALGFDLGAPCLPIRSAIRAMWACPLLRLESRSHASVLPRVRARYDRGPIFTVPPRGIPAQRSRASTRGRSTAQRQVSNLVRRRRGGDPAR